MKILMRQFLGRNHSWSHVGWGIAKSLKKMGHEVHLFSTDGIKHLPPDLKENLIGYTEENQFEVFGRQPDGKYDCQISYTSMKNFPHYFINADKNRFGIWAWEWAGKNSLPTGFVKHYKACDYVCPPSQFCKRVFMESGMPESAIRVIPHGIHAEDYRQTSIIKLPTKKRFKILANIAQNHIRKNIPGMLEAYGKAFSNKDDVCLIIKGKEKKPTQQFDVSLKGCIDDFKQNHPRHADIKVFSDFIPDISALYRSVDASYTLSFCEGFYFVGLESIASGKLAIAPASGGQLDFLNIDNALLIDGKEEQADPRSMYWESKYVTTWFKPSVDDAVDKLRYAYNNFESMNAKIEEQRPSVLEKYDWKTVTQHFLNLCQ